MRHHGRALNEFISEVIGIVEPWSVSSVTLVEGEEVVNVELEYDRKKRPDPPHCECGGDAVIMTWSGRPGDTPICANTSAISKAMSPVSDASPAERCSGYRLRGHSTP